MLNQNDTKQLNRRKGACVRSIKKNKWKYLLQIGT